MKALQRRYGCATELALSLINGRWKPLIMARLKERPHRFVELQKSIPAISDKMLSQSLRELAQFNLIEQTDGFYRLDERGEALRAALVALHSWGTEMAGALDIAVDETD